MFRRASWHSAEEVQERKLQFILNPCFLHANQADYTNVMSQCKKHSGVYACLFCMGVEFSDAFLTWGQLGLAILDGDLQVITPLESGIMTPDT